MISDLTPGEDQFAFPVKPLVEVHDQIETQEEEGNKINQRNGGERLLNGVKFEKIFVETGLKWKQVEENGDHKGLNDIPDDAKLLVGVERRSYLSEKGLSEAREGS